MTRFSHPISADRELDIELEVDPRATAVYETLLDEFKGDTTKVMAILIASMGLAAIGQPMEGLKDSAMAYSMTMTGALALTMAGVTAHEFSNDPRTASDKLAAYFRGEIEKGNLRVPGSFGGKPGAGAN